MKSTEERARYKNHLYQLGQGRIIDLQNLEYWARFWTEPESANDVFEALTVSELRTIRDQNITNYAAFIYILCQKLIGSSRALERIRTIHILNCIRLLTKLLPVLFETPDFPSIEKALFLLPYKPSEYSQRIYSTDHKQGDIDDEPLAYQLVHALIDLLFCPGFTVSDRTTKQNPLTVWEPGIGTPAKYQLPNLVIEANRTEVLKLCLTLCGRSLYQAASQTAAQGSIFSTYLVTSIPKQKLLTLVCSLINVFCRAVRSSPEESMLNFQNHSASVARHLYITSCVQFLLVMIIYPLPTNNATSITPEKYYNMARLYIGKLYKENEVLFLASSLISVLRAPIDQQKTSDGSKFTLGYYKANSSTSLWTMETVMFLWELLQCNKTMVKVVSDRFNPEIQICLLFFISSNHSNPQQKLVVRLAAYFMMYLSHRIESNEALFQPVNQELYNLLPSNFKGNHAVATTRDLLVAAICSTLSSHIPGKVTLDPFLTATLVEVLYNMIPLVSKLNSQGTSNPQLKLANLNPKGGLSYLACSSITNLIVRFSSKAFILEHPFHADLLALIIRSVCIAALRHPTASRMLLFSMLKNERTYDQVWVTVNSMNNEYFKGKKLFLTSIDGTIEEDQEEAALKEETRSHANSIASAQSTPSEQHVGLFVSEEPSFPSSPALSLLQEENEDEAEIDAIELSLRPKPPTGMTQKAREKYPMDAPISKTWAGNDALRIILTIVIPRLKLCLNKAWSGQKGTSVDALELVNNIEQIDFLQLIVDNSRDINYDFLPTSPFILLRFTWSHLALGWYTSLLYGSVYNSLSSVQSFTGGAGKIMKNLATSFSSFSKLTSWSGLRSEPPTSALESEECIEEIEKSITIINHWAKTDIKLFKIEAENVGFFGVINNKINDTVYNSAPSTPTERPAALARRISDLRLSNANRASTPPALNPSVEHQESNFERQSRNSVTSLHSLNTINRSRTATPRNAISM